MPEKIERSTGKLKVAVKNLSKTYGSTTAVNNISFEVNENEMFVVAGPNGAGKTSLIETIIGIRKPDSGDIKIDGANNNSSLVKSG